MSAMISECGRYRYTLSREWLGGEGTCLFVMLNPSTADATEDDPTIRRCIGFAQRLGYQRLEVGNLFAYRATDPKELLSADDPVGPENEYWLGQLFERASLIIAAWGASVRPVAAHRECEVIAKCKAFGVRLDALGLTKENLPRHPLYLAGDSQPVPFVGGQGEGKTTQTGHEVGAIYEGIFGGAYAVLGEDETGAVEVEQVVKGSAGKHYVVGSRWTHRTSLDHCSRKIGYATTQHAPLSEEDCERLLEIAQQIEFTIKDADWPEFPENDPADSMRDVRWLRQLAASQKGDSK